MVSRQTKKAADFWKCTNPFAGRTCHPCACGMLLSRSPAGMPPGITGPPGDAAPFNPKPQNRRLTRRPLGVFQKMRPGWPQNSNMALLVIKNSSPSAADPKSLQCGFQQFSLAPIAPASLLSSFPSRKPLRIAQQVSATGQPVFGPSEPDRPRKTRNSRVANERPRLSAAPSSCGYPFCGEVRCSPKGAPREWCRMPQWG